MGLLSIPLEVEDLGRSRPRVRLADVMVDTGSELTWIPAPVLASLGVARDKVQRFRLADGSVIARDVGFAFLHAAGRYTVDEVVFAEARDLPLLGARTLEGLNLRVDLVARELVHGGPVITAPAA
jgi:predicted aspartyl protease